MSTLNSQIGGSHYKDMAIQPIVFIAQLKAPFIEGCIIKYISRYKAKNGKQDIEKARHFALLALDLVKGKHYFRSWIKLLKAYCLANKMSDLQYTILKSTLLNDWEAVIFYCNELIQQEYPEE